ncbi:hypothetical protein SBA4_4050009 [Candidatus Sulfopaludibacter sp. SbA4]|nr:hypothetical protein SBA4_4050009 [Candidatus Sulfopaludibacter sp. SbA4]
MEEELTGVSAEPQIAQYWVLFLQPLPEAGERIAVALAFHDSGKRAWIRFDDRFSKVLRLYPDLDQGALRFYLESLQQDLNSCDDTEGTLNSYGPQLAVSSPRRIASPISGQVVEMLLRRYVYPPEERSLQLVGGVEKLSQDR